MTTLAHHEPTTLGVLPSPVAFLARIIVAVAIVRAFQWREWIDQVQVVVSKMRRDFGDSKTAVRRAQVDLDRLKAAINPALKLISAAQQVSLSGPDDPTPSRPSGLAATLGQWLTAFRIAGVVSASLLKAKLKSAAPKAAQAVTSVAQATKLYQGANDPEPKIVSTKGIKSWLPPLPLIVAPGLAISWLAHRVITGTRFPSITSGNIGKGIAAFGAAALIGTLLLAAGVGIFALRWFAGSPAK